MKRAPGVDMVILRRHFVVVKLAQWVVVAPGNSRRSPTTVMRTRFNSALVGADLRPGHVVKNPAVIAVVHDETTGLKADLWRYCEISDLVERVWKLFDHGECWGRCVFGAGSRC